MKNRSLHSGIKQSPYKAMFGIEPRVGLTSALPSAVIKNIHDEDKLQKVIEQVNAKEEQNETEDEEDAEENAGWYTVKHLFSQKRSPRKFAETDEKNEIDFDCTSSG
jgi:hypothetical protein